MAKKGYSCEECGRFFKTEEACDVHEETCKGKDEEDEEEKESKPSQKSSGGGGAIAFFIVLIIVLIIWGLIGGSQAQSVGVTCDMGIGDGHQFCWIWHTNAVGQVQEGIKNFFGQ